MGVTVTVMTLMRRFVILFGLVAIVATSASAQSQSFGGLNGWGLGSGSNPFNPSSDPNSNDGSGSGTGSGSGSGDVDVGNNGGISYGGGGGADNGGYSPGFGTGSNGFGDGLDYERLVFYRASHGLLASLAFAFFFPVGAIVIRVAGGRYALLAHGVVQLIAYALYIAAAGIGLYLVTMIPAASSSFSGSGRRLSGSLSANAHPILGIVILVALLSQPLWGVLHHRRFRRLKCRTWVSHVHIWVGRLGITLGIVNGGLGLALADEAGPAADAFTGVAVVMWTLWVLAVVVGEYRGARERRERQANRERIIREDRGYREDVRRRRAARRRDESPAPGEDDEADNNDDDDDHSHRRRSPSASPSPSPPPSPSPSPSPGLARPRPAAAPSDMPSPPYYPGPHYEAHMAHIQQQQQQQQQQQRPPGEEMRNLKEVMDMSDSASIMSASPDEMHRGQV
ncbi:hypothetical protein F5X97DRAFT_342442 [Nemania serpens]|nr:hypothetical protein F5X97DRAFT_342442 [Nemania serpens]